MLRERYTHDIHIKHSPSPSQSLLGEPRQVQQWSSVNDHLKAYTDSLACNRNLDMNIYQCLIHFEIICVFLPTEERLVEETLNNLDLQVWKTPFHSKSRLGTASKMKQISSPGFRFFVFLSSISFRTQLNMTQLKSKLHYLLSYITDINTTAKH